MISIIVPVYNGEKYLKHCIDSLLRQTFSDIEIICVDDGSIDSTGDILNYYAQIDSRLRLITQPNSGVSSARNRAMGEVRGEWVMFVDCDDYLSPETCETAYKTAIDTAADLVLWSYVRDFEGGRSVPRFLMDRDREFEGDDLRLLHRYIFGPVKEELRNPALLHSWGTVWGKLYRTELIKDARFTDTKIVGSAEDALFNAEVFNRLTKAVYINKAMYHYRKQKTSFTGGYNSRLNERWLTLYTLFLNLISANNLPSDFNEALNNRIALGLIGQGLNECKSPRDARGKIKVIRDIITTTQYREAIMNLQLKYFPLHWRLFFWAAKNANASVVYLLLLVMKIVAT